MAELNKEFIVDLKGKKFVTYNGLIDLAHQMKLKSITTEIIQLPTKDNGNQCITKAVATTEDGKLFEGFGDADPTNVNSMIARHLIRMAETRAKARALRDLTNVGMTAIEELGGEEEDSTSTSASKSKSITDAQVKRMYTIAYSKNIDIDTVKDQVRRKYNKDVSELSRVEYDAVCSGYENLKK